MEEELIQWILGWMFLGLLCNRGTSGEMWEGILTSKEDRLNSLCTYNTVVKSNSTGGSL